MAQLTQFGWHEMYHLHAVPRQLEQSQWLAVMSPVLLFPRDTQSLAATLVVPQ